MFVVTLPAAERDKPLEFASRARAQGAQILEIRGDLTPGIPPFDSPLPILASPRGCDLAAIVNESPQWLDLELGEDGALPEGTKLIRSFHDYEKTPSFAELQGILASCVADEPKPDIVKLATYVHEASDLLVLQEMQRPHVSGVEVVALGMGPLAWPNRVHSPWRNRLTYCALDGDSEAAPGQLLMSDYRALSAAAEPELFAVLGGPDMKSKSPIIHNGLFRKHRKACFYGAWPTAQWQSDFESLEKFGFSGFSITAPYKTHALEQGTLLDPLATKLGAANTLKRRQTDWFAASTDARGIVDGYPELKNAKSAEIIGSGGVVSSVIEALRACGVDRIRVRARNEAALEQLALRFDVEVSGLEGAALDPVDALFWTLPLDRDDIDLPRANAQGLAIDLRYGQETGFLLRCKELGYRTHDGMSMLKHQALAQFEIFTGQAPTESDAQFLSQLLSDNDEK